LEEAARIDGAGRPRTFFYIAFPLVTPGTLTITILVLSLLGTTRAPERKLFRSPQLS
jgi:ABC-type sugar transport system permease subunit